ncbi:helix-turn-helix domain-containing protein [Mesorhizobium sp. VK9D]|uniref:GlxA family transcriptional regulator n=1 Tax=Mesorhizobium australafricanum TaxID=3072311 RepID=UPI002A23EEEA|nr:helix-turn-helix domain-containing protein [Mesorhizobium sp. VK9D]MDX8455283.1 helix-turn-helix domain-containing protein [Mesorhizobium sp. VK9D]
MAEAVTKGSFLPAVGLAHGAGGERGTGPGKSLRLDILLLPGFSPLSLASFVEPFYRANWSSGEMMFRWRILGTDQGPTESSSGIEMMPERDIKSFLDCDASSPFVIIGGERIEQQKTSDILTLLRTSSRQKRPIIAIGTASWLLADVGILRAGMRCTIHWSKIAAFAEKNRDLVVEDCLFVRDGVITTCAGELAALDLAADLISHRHGQDLARRICSQLSSDRLRAGTHCQSLPPELRYTAAAEKLIRVIKVMERHLENPLPLGKVAQTVSLSRRQIERLFAKHLRCTPMQYYSGARLRHARQLLQTTDMPVIEVAIACGYVSSSHFTKSFKAHFGILPSRARLWAGTVMPLCDVQRSTAEVRKVIP